MDVLYIKRLFVICVLHSSNLKKMLSKNQICCLLFLGYLTCPLKDLWNVSKVLETIFMQEFDNERFIVKKLTTIVNQHVNEKCIMIPNEVIECLVRTRMYIRIQEMNRAEKQKSKLKY